MKVVSGLYRKVGRTIRSDPVTKLPRLLGNKNGLCNNFTLHTNNTSWLNTLRLVFRGKTTDLIPDHSSFRGAEDSFGVNKGEVS